MINVDIIFDVNRYFEKGGGLQGLRHVLVLLRGTTIPQEEDMSAAMDRLATSVGRLTSLAESLHALNVGYAEQIRDAAGDRERSLALADEIEADVDRMSGAVVDSTPAEAVPTAPPVTEPTEEPPPSPPLT